MVATDLIATFASWRRRPFGDDAMTHASTRGSVAHFACASVAHFARVFVASTFARVVVEDALSRWGWDPGLGDGDDASGRRLGRVTTEDRLGYAIQTRRGEMRAVLPGRLRREGVRPAVGDFVFVEDRPGQDGLPILEIVPRRTKLSRKASGRDAVEQIVAANVDVAFLVTAIVGDLSPRRLERYRAICEEGSVEPVVVLTKCDLVADVAASVAAVSAVLPTVPVHAISNVTGEGLAELEARLRPGLTVALVGSSGVGKSTLVNRWIRGALGEQATGEVREDGRGRHTTTSRALFPTASGALVVDTPGMRELGLWEAEGGVAATFEDVELLANACRFGDCRHAGEPGCAIAEALANGTIEESRVASWRKLKDELEALQRRRETRGSPEERKLHRTLSRAIRARLKAKGRT